MLNWKSFYGLQPYLQPHIYATGVQQCTPFEKWNGRKASVKHLRVFGSRVFALDKNRTGKFNAKGKEYIFVGYSIAAKAYRLYDREKRLVIERSDVKFVEGEFEYITTKKCNILDRNDDFVTNIIRLESQTPSEEQTTSIEDTPEDELSVETHNEYGDSDEEGEEFASANDDDQNNVGRRGPGRPKILRKGTLGRPKKVYNMLNNLNCADDIETPQTLAEALQSQYSNNWQESMQLEYNALLANDTWDLVDLPAGEKAIGSKWVFRIKRSQVGEIEKFKSRLVAKGCGQQLGVNYWETFSPVIRYETIRMLFAIDAEKQLYVHAPD